MQSDRAGGSEARGLLTTLKEQIFFCPREKGNLGNHPFRNYINYLYFNNLYKHIKGNNSATFEQPDCLSRGQFSQRIFPLKINGITFLGL
ncbi:MULTISPECIES: hypothetical protein [Stenotrophomonas]|uniref:hypothetical protein n=1 Tax=Stenotrophomonas TaxID=40323 RepID=UPI0013962315|nr:MULTISPECIES: hypothetical protein [Stenotrophomonas]